MKNSKNLVLGSIFALIAVIFVVLNTAPVAINFGFFTLRLPLIIVLVVMAIIGMIIAWFFGHDKRSRKKKKAEIKPIDQKKANKS